MVMESDAGFSKPIACTLGCIWYELAMEYVKFPSMPSMTLSTQTNIIGVMRPPWHRGTRGAKKWLLMI